jgi:hypothetical protein
VRAAAPPLSTASAPALAAEGVAALVLLAPQSAALQLFQGQLRLSLGPEATLRVPNIGTPPTAPFVAELAPAPVVQGVLSGTTLGPTKKILIISALTEELQAASAEAASVVIGHILAASAAKSIDATAFDANIGDDVRPPGLLYGVTPITASTGSGLTAIAGDLGAMAKAMADANVDPENFVIVAAPRQAVTLRLLAGPSFNYEILSSTGLPDKTVARAVKVEQRGKGLSPWVTHLWYPQRD